MRRAEEVYVLELAAEEAEAEQLRDAYQKAPPYWSEHHGEKIYAWGHGSDLDREKLEDLSLVDLREQYEGYKAWAIWDYCLAQLALDELEKAQSALVNSWWPKEVLRQLEAKDRAFLQESAISADQLRNDIEQRLDTDRPLWRLIRFMNEIPPEKRMEIDLCILGGHDLETELGEEAYGLLQEAMPKDRDIGEEFLFAEAQRRKLEVKQQIQQQQNRGGGHSISGM